MQLEQGAIKLECSLHFTKLGTKGNFMGQALCGSSFGHFPPVLEPLSVRDMSFYFKILPFNVYFSKGVFLSRFITFRSFPPGQSKMGRNTNAKSNSLIIALFIHCHPHFPAGKSQELHPSRVPLQMVSLNAFCHNIQTY